jgi:hypothetical protein
LHIFATLRRHLALSQPSAETITMAFAEVNKLPLLKAFGVFDQIVQLACKRELSITKQLLGLTPASQLVWPRSWEAPARAC